MAISPESVYTVLILQDGKEILRKDTQTINISTSRKIVTSYGKDSDNWGRATSAVEEPGSKKTTITFC